MIVDYKCKLTLYMTEEKFKNYLKSGHSESQRHLRQLLQYLNLDRWKNIKVIFSQDDSLLKFFTYKVLTRRGMPANFFDADKAFFGQLHQIKRSPLVTPWQLNKLKKRWSPDTINSYTRFWKVFLNLTLPNIFRSKNSLTRFSGLWPNQLIKAVDHQGNLQQEFDKVKQVLDKLPFHDNQLRLYSYFITFNKPLQKLLENRVNTDLFNYIRRFAKLTHTPGNFMLLPNQDISYRDNGKRHEIKNDKYNDFADLYIQNKDESFVQAQYLQMYLEPLFMRKDDRHFTKTEDLYFPYTIEDLLDCIRAINRRIKERESYLIEAYENRHESIK